MLVRLSSFLMHVARSICAVTVAAALTAKLVLEATSLDSSRCAGVATSKISQAKEWASCQDSSDEDPRPTNIAHRATFSVCPAATCSQPTSNP